MVPGLHRRAVGALADKEADEKRLMKRLMKR
jgi:hypothetical protein